MMVTMMVMMAFAADVATTLGLQDPRRRGLLFDMPVIPRAALVRWQLATFRSHFVLHPFVACTDGAAAFTPAWPRAFYLLDGIWSFLCDGNW